MTLAFRSHGVFRRRRVRKMSAPLASQQGFTRKHQMDQITRSQAEHILGSIGDNAFAAFAAKLSLEAQRSILRHPKVAMPTTPSSKNLRLPASGCRDMIDPLLLAQHFKQNISRSARRCPSTGNNGQGQRHIDCMNPTRHSLRRDPVGRKQD